MTTLQRFPVQVWTASDLRSLKWGSILFGVGIGLFLPRGLRRHGRLLALAAGAFAIKPLMNLLREDSVITLDRPAPSAASHAAGTPTSLEGAEAAD
jgi:hypothetical protein